MSGSPATLSRDDLYSVGGSGVYDAITRGDNAEIPEILRAAMRSQGPILELAAGSGRITFPLLTLRRPVTALDLSEPMIALLRERLATDARRLAERCTPVVGDMTDFRFDTRFGAVVVGTTSLSLLPDAAARRRVFDRVREHLADDGVFVLTNVELTESAAARRVELDGATLTETPNGDRTRRLIQIAVEGGVFESSVGSISQWTLRDELHAAGFLIEEAVEIPGTPPEYRNTLLVARARSLRPLWPSLTGWDAHGDDGRCVVSAHGTTVQMADGSRLVCGTSGLWNVNLGYGDPAIAAAIAEATTASSYAGVFRYENVYARRAAEDLIRLTDERFDTVVFTTSGGSANDAVLKIARQFWALRDMPHRKIVAGLEQSFHGLTYGAFGLTGEDLGRSLYGAETRLVRHIPANDVDALTALMSRAGGTIGALVVEPVLGTGNTVLTAEFVEALGAARDAHGVLLVVDEVATGFGRTGPLFASSEWPWAPDLLVTSKGLSNGTSAIAAILVAPRVARTFHDAGAVLVHAETQAGNAASCAAISATVQRFAELDALARGARLAARLDTAIDDLIATTPSITGVQGRGCFRALSLSLPDGSPLPQAQVPDVVAALRTTGRVIVHPGLAGIQLAPALTMTDDALAALFAGIRIGLAAFAARTS
ncbi:aminotransferase class III-fold pyridoxal phosphate-dependent enzyme [Microbacterium lacticum]|uniref:daptide-type RiPP biosynthesis aminotransferase n=1 Tax=Microbacterium lacticum TaxID=33885 RepID=UPI003A896397